MPGIVTEVPVDHDERVHKGDIVVKLDSNELQKELNGLIAEKQKAESQALSLDVQATEAACGPGRSGIDSRSRRSGPRP